MLGAVQPGVLTVDDGVNHLLQIIQTVSAVAYVSDRHRVEYCGNTAGDHQRIVTAHGRMGGPVNFRARREKLIEIVGVQLDKAWHQPTALSIQRLRQLTAGVGEGADHAVLHLQRSLDDLTVEHQFDVIDDHADISGAVSGFISYRRSATRSRTSASCKIPTTAAPRCFACSISVTTAARLVASSEAVGSSSNSTG